MIQTPITRISVLSCLHAALLACLFNIAEADPVPGQGTWETTLQPRDIDGNGSVDAYYDTVLDITWLADANYKATSNWDESQSAGGWPAVQFVEYLAGFGHLGVLNWRLPSLDNSHQGNTGGELEHLYLHTLGNVPGTGPVNTGPFANLQATEYLYDYPISIGGLAGQVYAKSFSMVSGIPSGYPGLGWAVADGDVQRATYTAPTYELVELGSLGGAYSRAEDINNRGQIVGAAQDAGNRMRAFLYQEGVMQDLGTLMPDDSGSAQALGINDLGEVTGSATVPTSSGDTPLMGFHFDGSQMVPLGAVPVDAYNYSFLRSGKDLNDSGEIAVGLADPVIHDDRFGLRTATGQMTIEASTNGSYPLALNWIGTALGEMQTFGSGPFSQRLLSAGQFRVVANNTLSGNSQNSIRLYALSDQNVVAGSLLISPCGSNYCDPTVSHGIVADADDLPLTQSKLQEILGTRELRLINSNGELVGKYANRWVVKPVGGPSIFLDSLVNLQGWKVATLDLRAMNEYGDIVGAATKTGASQSQAVLLRRLNVLQTNLAPLAHISARPTVLLGDVVQVAGRIKDYEGDALTKNWALTQVPAGSAAVLDDAATLAPTFTADAAGTYTVTLVANDGSADSNTATAQITARASNAKPQASITTVSPKRVNTLVQLNGSASDPDNDPVTVLWTLTQVPAGSQATLSGRSTLTPTFRPDVAGTYWVTLVANDGFVDSDPAQMQITVYPNTPPVADAGANQFVAVGTRVQLRGTYSDADNDPPVSLRWTLTQKPSGSTAVLSSTTGFSSSFVANLAGTYLVTFIAFDGYDYSAPSQVQIIASANTPPVANAGANQIVIVGDNVQLSGSVSDADNNPTTVNWTLAQKPAGSTAVLIGPTTLTPSFSADVAGTFVVSLVANDGVANSNTASVQITVQTFVEATLGRLQDAIVLLESIPAERLKNLTARRQLVANLNDAIDKINAGNYSAARAILSSDVVPRVDGCAIEGSPDKNDALLSCADQGAVYPLVIKAMSLADGAR